MATRRERVVLELDDDFTPGILRAAAATKLLDKELNSLSGRAVRDRGLQKMSRDAAAAERDVSNLGRSAQKSGSQIDTLSGRVGLLTSALVAVGPGLIPVAALGVPAIAGLAAQFGFAAAGAGVMIGSLQGVGDALKAVNKAQLEPTEANLQAAKLAMSGLSTEAQGFVRRLQQVIPELKKLRDTGAANMLPGFTEGIDSLESALPRVQGIVAAISKELGDIGADTGASLASDRWAPFLDFIGQEAPAALHDMSQIAGNTAHAMAELWMAFDPLNDDFSSWMVSATRDLDQWASGLSKTQGFADFIAYVQSNGPQVGQTLEAIANAFLQVVEAAAPLGGPVLHILEALANAVAAVADSDLGTPIFTAVAAWRAYAVAADLAGKAQARFNTASAGGFGMTAITAKTSSTKSFAAQTKKDLGIVASTWATAGARTERESARIAESSTRLKSSLGGVAKGAAGIAALGVASTGAADKIGLTNTASLALLGTFIEPGWGTAIGAAVGAVIDLAHANDTLTDATTAARAAMQSGDIDQMTAAYARLNAQIKKTKEDGPSTGEKLLKLIPVVGTYLDTFAGHNASKAQSKASSTRDDLEASTDVALRERGAAAANAQMAASSRLAADGFKQTAAGAREASGGLDAFTASAQRANAAISRQGTFDAARAALLDYEDSLKENGKTLDKNTRAGLANRESLRNIATTSLAAGDQIKNMASKSEYLQKQRKNFIDAAQAAGATRAQAKGLADQFGLLDRIHAKPKVDEQGADESRGRIKKMRDEIAKIRDRMVHMDEKGAAAARARIQQLRDAINALRDRTVTITERRRYSGNSGIGSAGQVKPDGSGADGATVPKTGKPYADRHLYLVADGERIVSNRHGQVDANADILDAINNSRGRLQGFADGGTAGGTKRYVAGSGVTVQFPTPSSVQQYVVAANQIAVAAANTARSAEETRQSHLADLHQQQQIRDLQKSLNEHVMKDVKVKRKDKKGHVHTVTKKVATDKFTLTGLDRKTAQAELADAKAALTQMRKISDAGQQALDALAQARADAKSSITGGLDLFAGSAGTAARNADRYVADVASAGQVMAQLRAKGASPLLLAQMAQHVQQGDAHGVVRLGQQFLSHPELLTSIDSSLSALGSVSAGVAALTSDPRFLGSGKFDPTSATAKVIQMQVSLDQNQMVAEISRRVAAELRAQLIGA